MGLTSEGESKEASHQRGTGAGVLVIASPGELARGLQATLARRGYLLSFADTAERGIRKLAVERATRVVVIVLPLIDSGSRELMKSLREIDTHVPFLLVGSDRDVAGPEEAMQAGAAEYLEDPLGEPSEFLARVGFVVGARRGDRHLRYLQSKDLPQTGWQSIVGQSPRLREVVAVLQQVCARAVRGATPTILVGGETGTGKGYIAKCAHSNGPRRNRPFVEVNCAALPASLIEAELFGYERGSFTDAKTSRSGLFETADGGTLFLDEIGTVPLDLQAKLLTAIEEKRVRRLGARTSANIDVQIIAATHADLKGRVRDGTFREDLFHRLNVVSVVVPALRERAEDVVFIGEWFLQGFCRDYGIPQRTLGPDARAWMMKYTWPGNVRELRNQIERIVLLSDEVVINAEHFRSSDEMPKSVRVQDAPRGELRVTLPPTGVSLVDLEREVLRQALAQCDGNVSRAARFLSISRQTLIYRMKKHQLSAPTE